METDIYIIKRSAFSIYKTRNLELTAKERERDFKNSYPINIPIPTKGKIRIDGISSNGYHYGMIEIDTLKDPLIALIEISHEGIQKITRIKNGYIQEIQTFERDTDAKI